MRPVDKGNSTKKYSKYGDARDELFEKIGMYCSYCEMPIKNMPEVEHVIPRNKGGAVLEWENFLLACKYCNTKKSDINVSRAGYLWPDTHNTFLTFKYTFGKQIEVNENLDLQIKILAQNTIDLLALDREPNSSNWDNHKDTRYLSRKEAWDKALESLKDWLEFPVERMANSICRTATSTGHFSIWMEVFKEHKQVMELFVREFKGTRKEYFNFE